MYILRMYVLHIDIEILASADVFIGSYSNVYALSAALRMSRFYPNLPLKQTCLIDYQLPGFQDHCEGWYINTR